MRRVGGGGDDHLAVGVEEVVDAGAAFDAKGLEEGLVRGEVAVEEPLVVLEDVHAQPVQLGGMGGMGGEVRGER